MLVGGPAVTGDIVGKMDSFFENFSKDTSADKRLDFVSWHEYGKSYHGTALREGQVQGLLDKHGIPKAKPMFVTEHDPVHGKLGTHELNLVNGAGLVKSLYFSNVYSPGMTIMPWVQYHISEIQTQFMWFDGPNEPDTQADELRMLPSGCSMKLLSMHKDWEIAVDNSLDRDELVLASVQNDGLVVHAVNYGETRDVRIQIDKLPQVFTALDSGRLRFVKYQIDETHSNGIADPSYCGGPQKVGEGMLTPENGSVTLTHAQLTKNGILMWILVPEKVGDALSQPVSHPTLPDGAAARLAVFDVVKAFDSARAEPQAQIERDGSRFRVTVDKIDARPGITFVAPAGGWSMAGLKAIEAKVKNTGKHTLHVHLVLSMGPTPIARIAKTARSLPRRSRPGKRRPWPCQSSLCRRVPSSGCGTGKRRPFLIRNRRKRTATTSPRPMPFPFMFTTPDKSIPTKCRGFARSPPPTPRRWMNDQLAGNRIPNGQQESNIQQPTRNVQ